MNGSCRQDEGLLLQPIWDMLESHQDLLALPFFPVLFAFTANLLACAPYLLLDAMGPRWPFFHRYKMKPHHTVNPGTVARCLSRICYNHGLFIFPATLLCQGLRSETRIRQAPSVPELCTGVALSLLLFDLLFFLWHLLHHRVPWLYHWLHSLHHQHGSTFSLSAQYASAWEILCLQLLAVSIPCLLTCHPLTEMTFFLLNIWLSVEDHCGYDLPWAAHKFVPFGLLGGAPYHDLHHQKFHVNYAPYFTHWDKLFQTYRKPSRGQPDDRETAERKAGEWGRKEQERPRPCHAVRLSLVERR